MTGLVSLESRGLLPEAQPVCPQPRGGNTAAPAPTAQTTPPGPSGTVPPPVGEYLKHVSALVCTSQWGAADAEIKVPSVENTELEGSPLKAWGRSVYSHTCYAKC